MKFDGTANPVSILKLRAPGTPRPAPPG
ncbi:MAG: hypothetical protein ACI8RZ_005074, partial [Myxococcota bacterium]